MPMHVCVKFAQSHKTANIANIFPEIDMWTMCSKSKSSVSLILAIKWQRFFALLCVFNARRSKSKTWKGLLGMGLPI